MKKKQDLNSWNTLISVGDMTKYKILKEDLEILANDVKKLLNLTKEICRAQIQTLEA